MRKQHSWPSRACWRLALSIAMALLAAACAPGAAPPAENSLVAQSVAKDTTPTSGSAAGRAAQPAATSTPTPPPPSPTPVPPLVITIETPAPGTLVGSPVVITGRTSRPPKNSALGYRVLDSAGRQIGANTFPVGGGPGQPGSFNVSATFGLPRDGGAIRVELFEPGPAPGTPLASSAIDLAVDAQYQAITIDTPPPGTVVGSPLVLTGQTARSPHDGVLSYRVLDSAGRQIGADAFPVSGAPGAPRRFNAELFFELPINGDNIRVELWDWNAASGSADASAAIALVVAPVPQQIIFTTPPPGTLVGSPVVITGRTTRYPFQGDLAYRFTDDGGQPLGAGTFATVGAVDQPASFNASLTFSLPRDGGLVHLELFDQNPADGAVVANSAMDLDVLAQYQAIVFETPAPGTTVGSPVVITGRTNLYPNRGQLNYRVVDAGGASIGMGSFPVEGAPGERGRFNASLTFAEPPNGGAIRLEVLDQAENGAVAASAAISLTVAPPPSQQIIFETPAPGTTVGSPVVITGRTTRPPANGRLNYRIRDSAGQVIGAGAFPVSSASGPATSFNASLTFTEPRGGGTITAEIYDQNGSAPTIASASIGLFVARQP